MEYPDRPCKTSWSSTVLTPDEEEEEEIVSWLIDSSQRGFGKTKQQIGDVRIKKILHLANKVQELLFGCTSIHT